MATQDENKKKKPDAAPQLFQHQSEDVSVATLNPMLSDNLIIRHLVPLK